MKVCPLCNQEFKKGKVCPTDGATLIDKTQLESNLIGHVLKDEYRIEEKIGAGGMGAVYRVTQIRLGRSVAIKILLPKLQSKQEMVQRFFREARLLSQLNHPNIVSIIDFGNTEKGLIFMVMEYLEGQSLASFVTEGRGLPQDVILGIMAQVCQGLAAAHQIPLVHRDLKPDNIFLSQPTGQGTVVKILDFGISKILGDTDEQLTQTGILMGTPGYMAPEQITHQSKPGVTTDIYALGAILYYMMGGQRPFSEHSWRSALMVQVSADPEPVPEENLAEPEVAALFPVVRKAMSRDPADRYQSACDLLDDLKAHATTGVQPMEALNLAVGADLPTQRLGPVSAVPTTSLVTKKKRPPYWALGGVAAVLLVAFVLFSGIFATKDPLLFGMSADFSGSNRELGREMQIGIQTYFEEVNQSGGIGGHKLELIALDDRYEPEPAKANMLEFIQERDVFAVIGNVGTPTAQASVPVALEHKTLFFGPFTGAGFLRKDPPDRYVFNYRASYEEEAAAIVRYFIGIAGVDPAAIAVFSQDDSFGDAGFQGVVRTLRGEGVKEEDILHVRYQRNQFDLAPAVAGILAAPERARAVVTVSTYKQTARFISEVREQLPETLFSCVSFVGTRALAEEFRENNPASANGVIVTQVVPFFMADATGVIRYREALAQRYPNQQPSFVSLEGYIAAQILVEGLRRSKAFETEAVIDALESIRDFDLGIGSVIAFGPSKHQASHKVWAVILDEEAAFTEFRLD